LLRESAIDPSEPRDDVVVSEAVHPFAPPTLLPRPAYAAFDQELRETSEDVDPGPHPRQESMTTAPNMPLAMCSSAGADPQWYMKIPEYCAWNW
jgi:hypothetical protein